jgi:CheY-like chemotaxis protein
MTRHRLLYIEDNPVNTLVMEELLARRADIELRCADTGEAGLAEAAAWQPQLVLVDMQLPDMDGFGVLQGLRHTPSLVSVPAIALSANAMPEDMARALAAGFTAYWTKPIDFKAFYAGLDAHLPRLV